VIRQPRQHCEKHLRFVASLECVICGSPDVQAAHIRMARIDVAKRPVGGAEKSDDRWTVPLCILHHSEQHGMNEADWWLGKGIDPIYVSMALWGVTGNYDLGQQIVRAAR
jgi:hypothetical protein